MKLGSRFPRRLIRWTSVCVCLTLVFSIITVIPFEVAGSKSDRAGARDRRVKKRVPQQPNGRKVTPAPPVAGPPAASLPNLDEVKQRRHEAPRAPEPVSSTMRSRRKPLESRQGRKVGDPLPTRPRAAIGSEGLQTGSAVATNLNHKNRSHSAGRRAASYSRSHHARLSSPLPQTGPTNVAMASNGGTASASSSYAGCAASGANNGDRKGLSYHENGTWGSSGPGFPQWLQVEFNGSKTIDEIDVFTLQNNYANPSEPTEAMTFSSYGVTGFEVQYWNGSAWTTVPSGSVSGNNQVWRKFVFAAINTSKIRVLINASASGWSELTEVEAWTATVPPPTPTNVALASNGGTASASSSYAGCAASGANNGDRKGLNYTQNGTWGSSGPGFPQWLQVDFNGSKTIDEIDVFTLQNNYANPSEPTETMTFSSYGVTGFDVQYWNGSAWATVSNGSVSGNNKVWRKFTFAAITISKIRVLINASASGWSEITEVEAWTAGNGGEFSDQYTQNFISMALARDPYLEEVNYWEDIFRAAYIHQQGSMMIAVREMARTMFESSDYAARGRTNHEFVSDLYKTYLMREPDEPGWEFWENHCNDYGREAVRQGFDESSEFATKVAAITPSGSPSSTVSSLMTARIDPGNQPGNQLLARDAEWGVTLLSLPGRAGLDLGLGLSYSSAVWTRSGPYLYFDEDIGTPSPGFRLGFPVVQEVFFDAQVGVNVRPMILPSGQRVEFRQVGTSNIYETADSSYLQLIDYGNTLTVRSTDGTAMDYVKYFDWRCTQIEDRNGNLLTVNNHWWGDIENISDTLGRVITFNYDTFSNLETITQNGRTEPWVTFGWGTTGSGTTPPMQPPSNGVGTYNNEAIPVLTQVGLADGSRYNFEYTSLGQVNMIRRSTPDNSVYVERASTTFNYLAADDSTRLSNTRVTAENWTDKNGVPHEVVTNFGIEGDKHTLAVDGDPNTTVYKETYGGTGVSPVWQRGLVIGSEVWSGDAIQKTTTTSWDKDINTPNNFPTNPRVTQTIITDSANNQRKTSIGYQTFTLPTTGVSCSLPNEVSEFEANGTTVARRTHTDYNLDTNSYLNRRIIGLPQAKFLYQGASTLMAKTTYVYDQGGEYLQGLPATPTQHDASYNTSFIVGRGNVAEVLRWDVSDPTTESKAHKSKMGYDINGSVVFTRDALSHQTTIGYTDAFAANGTTLDAPLSFQTFAYPTTVTDADGYSSSVRYRYDLGAATWKQTPLPNVTTNTPGPTQKIEYDTAARLQQVTNLVNNAYTRYEYGPNYVKSHSTVNTVADEAFSNTVFDGVGRVIATARNHPTLNGSTYSAVLTVYDRMGRAIRQSNPTETTATGSTWQATGDDVTNGWVYTQQTYDWKGRPLITTNPSITGNPNDTTAKEASYSACGCAGSEIVTLTDERDRQQKVYSDVLGRTTKTEVLNLNGSVYATTVNTLNGRDQVTLVRQFQGLDTSGVYQDTTMGYDGYGRLQTKHVPEQNAGTATTYAYNNDDTINSVTDARGAAATYSYAGNNRHLVTGISYIPVGDVPDTPDVSFQYDAASNRTSMTDGLGSKSYTYNQLSQLMSETRVFSDATNPSINGVSKTLSYGEYNLAGELKKITDSTNMSINYSYDVAGRLNGVTGSDNLYASVSNYASDFGYRAWGGLKTMKNGTNHVSSLLYNSKLQPTHFDISGNVVNQNYDYYDDGNMSFVHNTTDANFDRSYSYDHATRLTQATTGGTARGDSGSTPYHETFGFDAFSNLTSRWSVSWSQDEISDGATYTNNRRVEYGWGYDADGRNTTIGTRTYTFDVDGQMTLMTGQKWVVNHYVNVTQAMNYDGDGDKVKEVLSGQSTYYLRSSVIDEIVEEINSSGQKTVGYVRYPGGELLAQQGNNQVNWHHMTPAATTKLETFSNSQYLSRVEFDPLGANISLSGPITPDTGGGQGDIGANHIGGIMSARWSNFFDQSGGCSSQGYSVACRGVTSPGGYLEGQNRAFFGDKWYDLPGNNNEVGRAEGIYLRMVQLTLAAYQAAQQAKKKPKTKPKLQPPPKKRPSKDEIEKRKKHYTGVGKDEIDPINPAVIELVNNTLSSQPCIDFFTTVLQGVSNNRNPVRSNGDLRQIFQDFINQPKPHQLLTRQAPAGSWGYGNAIGNIQASTAAIYSPTPAWDAQTIINELFHLAGSTQLYTDRQLADFVHQSTYDKEISNYVHAEDNVYNIPDESERTMGDYSVYFHYIQMNICNATPNSTHKYGRWR